MLRNWVIERLSNSIRHEYNKDLEQHKAQLKAQFDAELEVRKATLKARADAELEVHKANALRLVHIDRSHFDMELTSFQKLWSAISTAVDLTAQTASLYSYTELAKARGEKRKTAVAADDAFFVALKVIQELRPFIPPRIHEHARDLAHGCKVEIDLFFEAIRLEQKEDPSYDQSESAKLARHEREKLEEQWNALADLIQERLEAIPGEQIRDPASRANATS